MLMHWPLGLDASLTPTPAEPRNTVVALKAWVPEASIVIDGEQADSENIESQTVTPAVQFSGVTIMAENVKTVEQKMDELSVTVDRILKYIEDTPALKNVGYVSGTGGIMPPVGPAAGAACAIRCCQFSASTMRSRSIFMRSSGGGSSLARSFA